MILFDLDPQAVDMDIQNTGVRGLLVSPHFPEQFLTRQYLLRSASQLGEKVELDGSKRNFFPITLDDVARNVDNQITDVDGVPRDLFATTQLPTNARCPN